MKNMILKRITAVFLICILLTGLSTNTADAAVNKALKIPYSFKNLTWEKDGDKTEQNGYTLVLQVSTKSVSLKGLKREAVVYVPKKAVSKKGSGVDFSLYADVHSKKGKYIGWIMPQITLILENRGGKVKMYAWHEIKQKEVKASPYASVKAGNGKYKDYYIVTLKQVPLAGEILGEGGKKTKITNNSKGVLVLGLTMHGRGNKTDGTLYVDSMTASSGKKTIADHTFSKKAKWYDVLNNGKKINKKTKVVKL